MAVKRLASQVLDAKIAHPELFGLTTECTFLVNLPLVLTDDVGVSSDLV